MNIGNKISEIMNEKGMNANELANQIGVTPSTIYSLIKRDGSRIDIDLLIKIAHALGMSVDLFLGIGNPGSDPQYSPFDAQFLKAYHSASDEAKSIVRYTLKLPEEPAEEKTDMIS